MSSDLDEVMQAFHKILSASENGDVESYLNGVTDDAVMMHPGSAAYIGKDANRPFLTEFFKHYTFQLKDWKIMEQQIHGDWAMLRYTGIAVFTPKAGGESSYQDRKYIEILRKENNVWKFSHHIYNLNTS